MAESAAKRLYAHGAYEARIITLNEALPPDVAERPTPAEADAQGQPKGEMVAQVQGDANNVVVDNSQREVDGDAEVDASVDEILGIEQADRAAVDVALDAEDDLDAGDLPSDETVVSKVSESLTHPEKKDNPAAPDENKTTAVDIKAPEVIKYKDNAFVDGEDTDLCTQTVPTDDEKMPTPSNVISDLKKAIAEFEKCAEKSSGDVTQVKAGSFDMTAASSFGDLLKDLEDGTGAGVKRAQVRMTSWMNVLTSVLPVSVQRYVLNSGRKSSLKQLFDDKKAAKDE